MACFFGFTSFFTFVSIAFDSASLVPLSPILVALLWYGFELLYKPRRVCFGRATCDPAIVSRISLGSGSFVC